MGTSENEMARLKDPALLEFLRAYFMDEHSKVDIRLVDDDRELVWLVQENVKERSKVVDQPLEFFINAQIHLTQSTEVLIEEICHTLEDICRSWAIGSPDCKHYITFRSPQKVMKAPTGTVQLTLVASVYTDLKGRDLFLRA